MHDDTVSPEEVPALSNEIDDDNIIIISPEDLPAVFNLGKYIRINF